MLSRRAFKETIMRAAAVVLRRGRGDPACSGRRAHGRVAKGQRVLRLELDVAGRRFPGVEEHDAPPVRGRRGHGGDEGPEPDVRGPRHRVDEVAGEADDAPRDGRRGREHVPAPPEDEDEALAAALRARQEAAKQLRAVRSLASRLSFTPDEDDPTQQTRVLAYMGLSLLPIIGLVPFFAGRDFVPADPSLYS